MNPPVPEVVQYGGIGLATLALWILYRFMSSILNGIKTSIDKNTEATSRATDASKQIHGYLKLKNGAMERTLEKQGEILSVIHGDTERNKPRGRRVRRRKKTA